MKITKSKLKQIIKEEMESILNEAKGTERQGPWAPPRVGWDTTGKLKPGEVIPGGMDPAYEPDDEPGGAGDIDILEAFAEVLDVAGRGSGNLSMELRRLAEIAAKNPEFGTEEPETSDVDSLELSYDPEKHLKGRQQTREQGGYNRRGWKPRE
jgi:hypothetical protein